MFRLADGEGCCGNRYKHLCLGVLDQPHAHILLKSGAAGLSTFMRKLLSGYATGYNLRHKRHGHLFQNRYKSIVCEEEPYFLRLVSYIHLNPLRAGLTETLDDLERYPWSGHAVVMNRIQHEWQDRNYTIRNKDGTLFIICMRENGVRCLLRVLMRRD